MTPREQLASTLSETDFQKVFDEVFRNRFQELGCRGLVIDDSDVNENDESEPFVRLCREIAERIQKQHEFKPITVTICGSSTQNLPLSNVINGLHVAYYNTTLYIHLSDAIVTLSYSWPESYCIKEENGEPSQGSHSSKDYNFNLADPGSVDNIFTIVDKRIIDMFTQWRPSD